MQALILLTFFAFNSGFSINSNLTADGDENGFALAIDIDQSISSASFTCMKNSGFSTAFIRAYMPIADGMVDSNFVQNVYNARQVGLGTEVYAIPQAAGIKTAAQQFDEIYSCIKQSQIALGRIWLKVTSPIHWPISQQNNFEFIQQFIQRAGQYNVLVGIYTNWYDWLEIANSHVYSRLLWYWNVLGEGETGRTAADFSDFRSFAAFINPIIKTYARATRICGTSVDQIVYPQSYGLFSANSTDQNDKMIIVGSIQIPYS